MGRLGFKIQQVVRLTVTMLPNALAFAIVSARKRDRLAREATFDVSNVRRTNLRKPKRIWLDFWLRAYPPKLSEQSHRTLLSRDVFMCICVCVCPRACVRGCLRGCDQRYLNLSVGVESTCVLAEERGESLRDRIVCRN